ncbi:MAG: threonine/serine dehydratase [Gemmatimonadaceae bacterium]
MVAIRAARERIADVAVRTPLVRLDVDEAPGDVWLKLENLQPVGSFKLRGAANAMRVAPPGELRGGVYTASAGNMAQGVAWMARAMGVPCTVIVPEGAPRAKLDAIARLGARTMRVPFAEWWQTMTDHGHADAPGRFVHPFADADVMAGNGTIGLEIVEDLPDVDAVFVPYGGGGLACGIASAMRHLRPAARVFACEPSTAAPLAASLAAGEPLSIERTASFIDGCGGMSVFREMWPLASTLLAGSLTVTPAEVASAVRLLAERTRIVAEGAGAVPVAAALRGSATGERALGGTVVCIVSGGNIDAATLATILGGGVP